MDKDKLDEIKRIADEKKESDIKRKKESEDFMVKRQNEEKAFVSSFVGLQSTVFKTAVSESAQNLNSVGKLELETNHNAKELKDQIRKYARVTYMPKGIRNPILLTYLNFEANSNQAIVKVTEKSKTGQNATVEILGEFDLNQLNKDKIETLIFEFIKKVVK